MAYVFFLLIYATFIAVVKADGLSDISNNLASDLGPLLALFGDEITRQYLSESIGFLDYFIFAMAPIGIIATITAAIRICGSSALRAFIGRAQEGDGTTEAELCTSTSADVCELFNKSGIARVLGRPDIVELIYTPDDPKDERFHIFTKYLDRPVRHYWEKNQFSGSGHALFSKIFFSSDESTEFAPKPNLSLNVGVRRRPDWIFYVVAIVGFILQAGILVFAGTAVLLLGWNIHESDGEVITQNYAPGIFIVGTIVLCSGVWGCATLIGQTTTEMYYQRKSKSSPDVLYWIQPGPQVIGDQFFYPFAYSDANKVEQRNRIWMSSTQSSNRKKSEVLAFIAVLLVLFGYVGQFIGLRGLNAWISIAQLAITLFMSILRSILRMDRLDKNDNCLDGRRDLVAGHELDWLAFNIAGLEFQQRQERLKSNQLPKEDKSQEYQEKLCWYVTGQCGETPASESTESARHTINAVWLTTLSQQLLKNRIRLANLTGHLDNSEEAKRITHWKDESIRVRTKARSLKAALCGAAAALLRDQTPKDEVHLRLVSGLSYGDTNDKNSVVTIEMEPPKGLNQINWTLDSSKLEAVLGLWLWSIVSKDYESYKRLKDSSDSTNPRSEKPTAKIFRVVSACTEEQGWDDSVDADMSIWLGSRDLNITQQTLDLNAGLNHVYSLADTWTEMPDTPEIWEYDLTPEVSKKPVQRICGWNLIYDAFRGNNSGTRSHDTTIIQGRVKVKGFPVKDTGNSLLEICAQELFVAFMLSMKNQGFREFSELSVNELAGNVRLENPLVSALTECFTGHSLGTYSDAISCLIPILRSDVTSNREQLLSALAQAATKYRRDGRWEGAEIILRWGCHYYCLLSQRSADKASLFTELLRELGELYRWSLAQGQNSDRQDFGKNGIQWMRENFGNAPNESIQAAIVLDYEEVVKEITGKDLQDLSMLKYTSAVASRKRGQSLVLLCLMTSRRDINSSEFSHVLPFAARNGWHEVVSALLEMKANPNSQDSDGRTAASHCAELGRQELLQRLIAKGADLDLADKRDMTPLDYTAKNGRKDVLKLLMKIDSLDLNRKMYNGRSALWLAIDQHHVKVMKELLDNGANVNEKDDHGFWPLQMAVKRGHEDAVELLLSQRSIIAWRNAARDSLLWASWRGYADIMRLLLKKGSESGSSDAFGPDRIREEVEDLLKMHADNAKYIPPLRNHSDGFFSTTDIRPPSLPTVKDMQHIQFDPPHSSTPQLMIGISALNMKSDSHIDTHWEANSVLQTGFSLVRKRYQEAEMFGKPVRSASAVWLEFGAEDKNFQVGQFPVSQHSSSIIRIPFQDKFDKAPHIVVWLNGLYLPNIGKIGWHINAKYVYATGSDFHFTIEPADEGSENQLSVSWLAYPSESTDVKSGSDFIDTRPLLGLAQEKRVDFVTRLRRTPRVFLALSGFAMQSSQEVDIEVKVNKSDPSGFSWTGNSPSGISIDKIYVNWVAFG